MLPWSKAAFRTRARGENEVPRGLFGLEEDDETEGQETGEGDPEAEGDGEAEDDLADVDPELRARFERVATQRTAQVQDRLNVVREKARERGVAITDDGDLALLDAQRLAGWVPTQPQQQAQAQTAAAAAPAAETDDEIPDPSLDPTGFQRWFAREQQRAIEAATKPILEQLRQTNYAVANREAVAATERAARVVEEYGLGEIARHPAFAEVFQKTLLQTAGQADWNDDETLGRVALMIVPDLKKIPARPTNARATSDFPQRGNDGRWTKSRDFGRSAVSRGMIANAGPSQGSQKRGGEPQYDEIDKITAERLGCSLEEARALKDPSGDAYTAIQAKKAGAAGRPRR